MSEESATLRTAESTARAFVGPLLVGSLLNTWLFGIYLIQIRSSSFNYRHLQSQSQESLLQTPISERLDGWLYLLQDTAPNLTTACISDIVCVQVVVGIVLTIILLDAVLQPYVTYIYAVKDFGTSLHG